MSDARVRAAVAQVEAWLADPAWEPDPDQLTRWNEEFQSAQAAAERGPGWTELAARAHELGARMEARLAGLVAVRDAMKGELGVQARGERALRGYRVSIR